MNQEDKNFYGKLCVYGGTVLGGLVGTSILGILSPFVSIDGEMLLLTALSSSFFGFLAGTMVANSFGLVSIDSYAIQQAVENAKRDANERKALFKGLMSSLVLNERIELTEPKAKAIKGELDKLVTRSKKDAVLARKLLSSKLYPEAIEKMIKDIAPRFEKRQGGYTRMVRLGKRFGDDATMVVLEWTEVAQVPQEKKETAEVKEKKAKKEKPKKEVKKKEKKNG